jgi:hypothetical protein
VGRVKGDAGVRVDHEPQHFDQCVLGRRLLAAQHQDGIRTDRPEDHRQPGNHQAKPADYRMGTLGIHMLVRQTERVDDSGMPTVLRGPIPAAREDLVVSGNRTNLSLLRSLPHGEDPGPRK